MSKDSHRLYGGQRAKSFYPQDIHELIELRARQRTFDGAYGRSGLGNLGYALTILRLFDKRFYRIGIAYAILAGFLFVLAFFRQRHLLHDFADHNLNHPSNQHAVHTVGQSGKRLFGRPFVTAGWIVVALAVIVGTIELGLLVLVLQIQI